ncbi:MAG: hypothetical protein ACE5GX_05200 [Thermoanaerobaculia bacterium]
MKNLLGALLLTLALSQSAPVATAAASDRASPARGELIEALAPGGDESESYAIYLPTGYQPERTWPVVIVMDPRGRATTAGAIFVPAAERFGYVVLSSASTRSDLAPGSPDPNEPALRALLDVAVSEYAGNPARIYLAGFSGTSRFAWMAGKAFPDRIAGVIGVGGGLPGPWRDWNQVSFSYFGAAGKHDFNHREMRELDELLDGSLAHRFHYFSGGHQWPDEEDAELALGWMELQAMRRGLAEPRTDLIASLFEERMRAAEEAERRGDAFGAFEALLAITEDFEALSADDALDPIRARLAALASSDRVKHENSVIAEAIESEREYREKLGAIVRRIAYEPAPPDSSNLSRELEVLDLQSQARGESRAADSARRRLELAFVHMAFYTPSGLMAKNAPRRAALSLEIATAIFPDRVFPWLRLAEARASAGQKKAAILAVAEAVNLGFSDADYLRSHDGLKPLDDEPTFEKLIRQLE